MTGYENSYGKLLSKLKATRRKETSYILFAGFFNSVSTLAIILLILSAVELVANGDEAFRGILALLGLLSSLAFLGYYTKPGFQRIVVPGEELKVDNIALRVGEVFPDIKDTLSNAIQIIRKLSSKEGTSDQLAVAAFEAAGRKANEKNFDLIINTRKLKKSIFFFLSIAVVATLMIGLTSPLASALDRLLNWDKSYIPDVPYTLTISPLKDNITRNDPLTINIKAKLIKTGESVPESIVLFIKELQQENYDQYTLKPDSAGNYKYEIRSLKASVTYYAQAMWYNKEVKTPEGTVTVTDKPLIKSLSGRLNFPGYTGFAPKIITEQNAELSGLVGSRADLQILSNKDLEQADIIVERTATQADTVTKDAAVLDTTVIPMKISGKKAFGSLSIRYSGTYYISIKDKDGQVNTDPIRYPITALHDNYPVINMLEPLSDVTVTEDAMLFTKVSISDDYGFSKLILHYRLVESLYEKPHEKFSSMVVPVKNGELAQEIPYLWNLNQIRITPQDKYEYYYEVFDNDVVSGPKSAKTQVLTVRLPSLDEVIKIAEKEQNKIEKDLEKVLKETSEIKKDVEDLNRELLKKINQPEMEWKDKKKAEDIMKKQAELKEKIGDIQQKLQDLTKQMQQNNVLSPETVQKYQELQNLLKEVNSPELRKMQDIMNQAMQNMSPQEMQKAMENFKFDEEQLKKSIDRTMKILQRLKAEQKVDALTKRAEELKEKQDELNKAMNNTNPNSQENRKELAEKQDKLQDELEKIGDEMKDLEQLMKDIGDNMPMEEMEKAKDALDKEETSKEMQQAEQNMQKGDFSNAAKNQQNAQKNLQKFASQMQNLKNEMNNQITKEAIRKMQKAVNDMLELSKKQENLAQKTKGTESNSTKFPELTKEQADIKDGLSNVVNSMIELSQKSFAVTPQMGKEIGSALQQMEQSFGEMTERKTSRASQLQQGAMASMNRALSQMQQMVAQMQQQGNGSCPNPGGMGQGQGQGAPNPMGMSFAERLQQAAALQQMVNQSMQQMGGNGGKLSPEQQAEIGRLADKQGSAQKSVQELAQEQKIMGGDRKSLGDLQKLADDMKDVMTDIKSGQVTPETMKKQERILSRLLDATKSIHDRDFEKKRESNSGKDYLIKSPAALDMNTREGRTKALRDLMKSIQQGYTKDYEQLIRSYFDAIQSKNTDKNN